eukprot:6673825-Pyramimonas_sp.AAC.1
MQVTSDKLRYAQRGFISGRSLADNIFEFDGRLMMRQALDNSQADGGALFEMKSAFPSVHYFWLFLVLQRWRSPPFLINCIRSLYERVWCSMSIRGSDVGGFWAPRGVKQ